MSVTVEMTIEEFIDFTESIRDKYKKSKSGVFEELHKLWDKSDVAPHASYYTSQSFDDVNNFLRGEYIKNSTNRLIIDSTILGLDKMMQTGDRFFDDIILYRGVTNINVDDIFYDPGYMSTSTSMEIALSFIRSDTCCLWKINAPSGMPYINMEKYSLLPGESEILLPRGIKLKKIGTDEINYRSKTILIQIFDILSYDRNLLTKPELDLLKYIEDGDIENVKIMIDEGININFGNQSPLRIAVQNKHIEIISLLLENGALITDNIRDIAVKSSDIRILEILNLLTI